MYNVYVKIRQTAEQWSERKSEFATLRAAVEYINGEHQWADRLELVCGRDYEIIMTSR